VRSRLKNASVGVGAGYESRLSVATHTHARLRGTLRMRARRHAEQRPCGNCPAAALSRDRQELTTTLRQPTSQTQLDFHGKIIRSRSPREIAAGQRACATKSKTTTQCMPPARAPAGESLLNLSWGDQRSSYARFPAGVHAHIAACIRHATLSQPTKKLEHLLVVRHVFVARLPDISRRLGFNRVGINPRARWPRSCGRHFARIRESISRT
jgi:hypothetical protein